eukprot:Rmarinus@m.2084
MASKSAIDPKSDGEGALSRLSKSPQVIGGAGTMMSLRALGKMKRGMRQKKSNVSIPEKPENSETENTTEEVESKNKDDEPKEKENVPRKSSRKVTFNPEKIAEESSKLDSEASKLFDKIRTLESTGSKLYMKENEEDIQEALYQQRIKEDELKLQRQLELKKRNQEEREKRMKEELEGRMKKCKAHYDRIRTARMISPKLVQHLSVALGRILTLDRLGECFCFVTSQGYLGIWGPTKALSQMDVYESDGGAALWTTRVRQERRRKIKAAHISGQSVSGVKKEKSDKEREKENDSHDPFAIEDEPGCDIRLELVDVESFSVDSELTHASYCGHGTGQQEHLFAIADDEGHLLLVALSLFYSGDDIPPKIDYVRVLNTQRAAENKLVGLTCARSSQIIVTVAAPDSLDEVDEGYESARVLCGWNFDLEIVWTTDLHETVNAPEDWASRGDLSLAGITIDPLNHSVFMVLHSGDVLRMPLSDKTEGQEERTALHKKTCCYVTNISPSAEAVQYHTRSSPITCLPAKVPRPAELSGDTVDSDLFRFRYRTPSQGGPAAPLKTSFHVKIQNASRRNVLADGGIAREDMEHTLRELSNSKRAKIAETLSRAIGEASGGNLLQRLRSNSGMGISENFTSAEVDETGSPRARSRSGSGRSSLSKTPQNAQSRWQSAGMKAVLSRAQAENVIGIQNFVIAKSPVLPGRKNAGSVAVAGSFSQSMQAGSLASFSAGMNAAERGAYKSPRTPQRAMPAGDSLEPGEDANSMYSTMGLAMYAVCSDGAIRIIQTVASRTNSSQITDILGGAVKGGALRGLRSSQHSFVTLADTESTDDLYPKGLPALAATVNSSGTIAFVVDSIGTIRVWSLEQRTLVGVANVHGFTEPHDVKFFESLGLLFVLGTHEVVVWSVRAVLNQYRGAPVAP